MMISSNRILQIMEKCCHCYHFLGSNICFRSPFWTPGSLEGSLVIALVRWSVSLPLDISETVCWFFLIFCMKLGHHKGTKATEPDFWKKIVGGRKWGKTPIFGAFLMFFVHISKTALRILTKICLLTVLIDT